MLTCKNLLFIALLVLACSEYTGGVRRNRKLRGGCRGTRYGCCPDGKTAASGRNGQGCRPANIIGGCRGVLWGCCEDGVTPAGGPNKENCAKKGGCAGTRYGCCPDGRKAATGPNEAGCNRIILS